MHTLITHHRIEIAAICKHFGVSRLEVFGSAARGTDFKTADSDVDFLVEFLPGVATDLQAFLATKIALEKLLGRAVDLVESDAVQNPYVLANINRSREPGYAS